MALDNHNNGRCAQHRTIAQARGPHPAPTGKETRALDRAAARQVLRTLRIQCPQCGAHCDTRRCWKCRFPSVPMPSAAALEHLELERLSATLGRSSTLTANSYLINDRRVVGAL